MNCSGGDASPGGYTAASEVSGFTSPCYASWKGLPGRGRTQPEPKKILAIDQFHV